MIELIIKISGLCVVVFLWGLAWTTAAGYEERKYTIKQGGQHD